MKRSMLPLRSLALVTLALALPSACASGETEETPAAEVSECASAEIPGDGTPPTPTANPEGASDRTLATRELEQPPLCVRRANSTPDHKAPSATAIPAEWPELREWFESAQRPSPTPRTASHELP
jgi:hypothetical protein